MLARYVILCCCEFDESLVVADAYVFQDDDQEVEGRADLVRPDLEALPGHLALEIRELV